MGCCQIGLSLAISPKMGDVCQTTGRFSLRFRSDNRNAAHVSVMLGGQRFKGVDATHYSVRDETNGLRRKYMDVSTAVAMRRSIRCFKDAPVDLDILRDVLDKARAAPSGGNVQPWHATVLHGDRLARLVEEMGAALMAGPGHEVPEYRIYPDDLSEPYRGRRARNGEAMYAALGITREDKAGRMRQLARNFGFFGAPVGLFVHMLRLMGPPQWADLGIWLQTVMLLLVEAGLGSCPQEAWSAYPVTVKRVAEIPDDHLLFCGLAIGVPDPEAAFNHFPNDRAALEEMVHFRD
jgi:nitroreductase